jgi:soluble lytic murein transglycosylase-like protein
MGALSHGTWKVLVPFLLTYSTVLGQNGNPPPATAAPKNAGAFDSAAAAMEKSLQQQQAALDAFRENVQNGPVREQQESAAKQTQTLSPDKTTNIVGAGAPAAQTSTSKSSSSFFTLPWPGSLPLAIPNVQMVTSSCDALDNGQVGKLVETAAGKHALSADLLRSVMKQESAFKPCALSTAGAMGLMQIMPETADMLHLDDPFDPAKNVDAGAKFLKMMLDRYGGDVQLALAAYNAGPSAVDRAQGVPPIAETLQYVTNILGDLPVAY